MPATTAIRYRHEAAELRGASEIVRDPRLREQLLDIARQYEAAAASIENYLSGAGEQRLARAPQREPGSATTAPVFRLWWTELMTANPATLSLRHEA